MATIAEQLTAAKAEVQLYAQTTVQPTIADSSTELQAIMLQCRRATIWIHNTAYAFGDVVLPTERNGHRYICVQAGTSAQLAANEPDWTITTAGLVGDGTDDPQLVWREDGPDWENVYDVRRAIHLTWLAKAAKASLNYSMGKGYERHELQQVYEHCLQMADKYRPVRVA